MPAKDRTRARKAPRQDRARASVDAILTATAELLRTKGFRRTTTNLIAGRAGVNVALVYRYFAGKEAIVGALIDRFAAETLERAREAMLEHAGAPFAVAVRALLVVLVETPGNTDLHRELYENVSAAGRRQFLQATGDAVAALFQEFLARREADLREDVDRDAVLFVLRHALEAASHAAAFYRPANVSQDRVVAAMTALVTRSLASEP
jgi:AcrR family transcriptional regulator